MNAIPDEQAALKKAVTTKRSGLPLARPPADCLQEYRDALKLRRAIEQEVVRLRGTLSLRDVGTIQTLVRMELSARMVERAMRNAPVSDVPAEVIRKQRAELIAWSLQRDKLLGELLGNTAGGTSAGGGDWVYAGSPDVPCDTTADVNPDVGADTSPHPHPTLNFPGGEGARESGGPNFHTDETSPS